MIPVEVHSFSAVWLAETFINVVDIGAVACLAEETFRTVFLACKTASRTLLAYSCCDIVVKVSWAKPTIFYIPVVRVRERAFLPTLLD